MELAVQLDDRRVDMLIIAKDGTTVAIECENDTILAVQCHIGLIVAQCPEIGLWDKPRSVGD
jgi:hypothetical protein